MARHRIPLALHGTQTNHRNAPIRTHTTQFQFFEAGDRDNGTLDEWAKRDDHSEWIRFDFNDGVVFAHHGSEYACDMPNVVVQMRMIELAHQQMVSSKNAGDSAHQIRTKNSSSPGGLQGVMLNTTQNMAASCVTAMVRADNAASIREEHSKEQVDSGEVPARKTVCTNVVSASSATKDDKLTGVIMEMAPAVPAWKETSSDCEPPSTTLCCVSGCVTDEESSKSGSPSPRKVCLNVVRAPPSAHNLPVDHKKPEMSPSLVGRKIQVGWTYHKDFNSVGSVVNTRKDLDLWCTGEILSMTSRNETKKRRTLLGYAKPKKIWYAEILFYQRLLFSEETSKITVLLDDNKWSHKDTPLHQYWRLLEE